MLECFTDKITFDCSMLSYRSFDDVATSIRTMKSLLSPSHWSPGRYGDDVSQAAADESAIPIKRKGEVRGGSRSGNENNAALQ